MSATALDNTTWKLTAYVKRILDLIRGQRNAALGQRFADRMSRTTFDWLASKLELGARPHHNFHVFDVYTRAGLMNDRAAPVLLETMDNCRIS